MFSPQILSRFWWDGTVLQENKVETLLVSISMIKE
jgi:hypothetical protein